MPKLSPIQWAILAGIAFLIFTRWRRRQPIPDVIPERYRGSARGVELYRHVGPGHF